MHELSVADTFRPSPVCILNLPLAEYSIGHELLLLHRRNALVVLSAQEFSDLDFTLQIHAIREAVWICSDPYGVREGFERPARFMWRFRWNEWKRNRWVKRLKNLLPQDYALAVAEFRNYLEAAHPRIPAPGDFAREVLYGEDDKDGRSMGQPMILSLYHFVTSLPQSEWIGAHGVTRPTSAWDFPYARALWLFFSKMESLGTFRIENFEERDEQSVMDEARAEARGRKADVGSQKPEGGGLKTEPALNAIGLATLPPDLTSDLGPPSSGQGGEA